MPSLPTPAAAPDTRTRTADWVWRALGVIAPMGVLAVVWVPALLHYHAPWEVIPGPVIEQLRAAPDDLRLARLGPMRIAEPAPQPREVIIRDAGLVLEGRVRSPDGTLRRFGFPFDPDDLDGALSWQLRFASLEIVDVLLRAYGVSGSEKYLDGAKQVVLAWASYERSAWLPRGFLWNDHAIAERTHVLVDFWRYYRGSRGYDPDVARVVLELIDHSAALLAKAGHFTVATNHGVMQNLALLHVSAALPALPGADGYKRLALKRLETQLRFFLSEEGVVLEHSPGYHELGLGLFRRAFDYAELMGFDVPVEWTVKYEKALAFYAQILRPDGSLATLGDTDGSPSAARIAWVSKSAPFVAAGGRTNSVRRSPLSLAVYPVSGYAVWWSRLDSQKRDSDLSHFVATWSHFPGHGHYRAQELALAFWAAGQEWWTNSGYWPYGYRLRRRVESWEGSNAPHLEHEPARLAQEAIAKGLWTAKDKVVLDLERVPEASYRVRRQIIQARSNLWLVLDSAHDVPAGKRLRTIWTTSPEVRVEAGSNDRSFRLTDSASGREMRVFILGSPSTLVSQLRGSEEPFGGLAAVRKQIRHTSSLSVSSSGNAPWHAMLWLFGDPGIQDPAAPALSWVGPERWSLEASTGTRTVTVQRSGPELLVGGERLLPYALPDTAKAREQLRMELASAAAQYPLHRDLLPWRTKVTYLLVALIVVQWLLVALAARSRPGYVVPFLMLGVMSWAALGSWLYFWYFT